MKIGTRVIAPNVDRYTNERGLPEEFPLPRSVEGVVVERAEFLDLRVCVEFLLDYQKYYVWKYAADVTTLG